MKPIEISDEVYVALQDLATRLRRTPDEVLALLLNVSGDKPCPSEALASFVLSTDFRANFSDADKYLALLSWVALRQPADFGEFIRSLDGGRRFLRLTREEILETCRHNQARQIAGTPYWAIMNLDTATKRRFLASVLEFVGYGEAAIDVACAAIGMKRARRGQFAALLA
ncbi:MAG: hypothetical protein ABIV50_05630 [Opitutus sp.]